MPTVTVQTRNATNTATASLLPRAFGIDFEVRRNESGSGAFLLDNDDPDFGAVTAGVIVQFLIDGTPRFAGRVVDPQRDEVSETDEDAYTTTFTVVGLDVDLDETPVANSYLPGGLVPGMDELYFNWAAPTFDVTFGPGAWEKAKILAVQGWPSPHWQGAPGSWTAPSALWVGPQIATASHAPTGKWCAKQTFLVPAGHKLLEWSADNWATLYINGREMGKSGDWRQRYTAEFDTVAGFLTLGWAVENDIDYAPAGDNPTGLIASLRDRDSTGEILWQSSADMDVLPYPPSIPGFTPGRVFWFCSEQGRESGQLLEDWITGSWPTTFTYDSGGTVWPYIEDTSFRYYEDSVLDVVRQLAELWIDWAVAPTNKVLSMWAKGTASSLKTVPLVDAYHSPGDSDPSQVNVVDLTWTEKRPRFNALGVRDASGWFERTTGAGDRWASLRLEQIVDRNLATQIADAHLALNSVPQVTATFEYIPLTGLQEPFYAFGVLDSIYVPREGVQTEQDVQSIAVTGGEDGEVTFAIKVGSTALSAQEWFDRAVARNVAGSLLGRSPHFTRRDSPSRVEVAQQGTVGSGGASHVLASAPIATTGSTSVAPPPFVGKVTWLRLVGQGSSGTSTVTVSDGTSTWTLSGTGEGVIGAESVADTVWNLNTMVTVELTTVNHASLHIYADVANL